MNDKNNQSKCGHYHQAKSTTQSKIRKMKEDWWGDRARRLQEAADRHDIQAFYQELKTVHGPSFRGATAVKDASGNTCTLLTEPSAIVQRWAEHFEQVWNRISIIDNAVFKEIPQQPTLDALAAPIQLEEVHTTLLDRLFISAWPSRSKRQKYYYNQSSGPFRQYLQWKARISWKDRVTNTEVQERCQTHGVEAHIMEACLRLANSCWALSMSVGPWNDTKTVQSDIEKVPDSARQLWKPGFGQSNLACTL